ncbi:hypothetical protein GALMADRAFT_75705, partial [Galerina marginata CBS 339.88]
MWHQIDTVVILRQNMRQKTQSVEDEKLRTALENMRYKACTTADLAFLRTRVAGTAPGQPDVGHPRYRHQSIITAWNSQKDEINDLGSKKFARDTGQELQYFYPIDEPVIPRERPKGRPTLKRQKFRNKLYLKKLSPRLRERLWSLPPSTNDQHIPGRVGVCLGMPIMIRYNEATELCMTRGQEGTVVGWQSKKGPHGMPVLDVLFVALTDPPQNVKFDGLPENVVPLTMNTVSIHVSFDSGWSTSITRRQIQ